MEEKPNLAWYTDSEIDDYYECPFKKVIFLDIDGVLNVEEESFETGVKIDPQKVKLLKMIVDETGADIILSSSWKRGYHRFVEDGFQTKDQNIKLLHDMLAAEGLKISGITPISHESGSVARPMEILEWLARFYTVSSYVILDDDTFWEWGFLQRNVVTTIAVNFIQKNGLWLNLKMANLEPKLEDAINQLKELKQKKYVDEPKYTFEKSSDGWECECSCGGVFGCGRAANKTKAKKKAAFMVLVRLLKSAGLCSEELEHTMWQVYGSKE